ncbi:MAG: hypothetical protein JO185_24970 [Acidobacteriaceae bacterium]|nr:hypothetical protein [Acidobacteriaceae bacterium]MBV9679614.1 hypothetical protein [Acidobacteriaceae bacterium]
MHERFGNPKRIEFYDAGHALNAVATHDRILWLVKELQLQQINESALNSIPKLK